MFEILPCGQAFIVANQIDVTYLIELRIVQSSAIQYCDRYGCNHIQINNLQTLSETLACENRHVEEILGVEEEVRVEVIKRGDRYFIDN